MVFCLKVREVKRGGKRMMRGLINVRESNEKERQGCRDK